MNSNDQEQLIALEKEWAQAFIAPVGENLHLHLFGQPKCARLGQHSVGRQRLKTVARKLP
jgi:hypothetical protein